MSGAVHKLYRPPAGHLPRIDRAKYLNTFSKKQLIQRVEAMRRRHVALARQDSSAFMEYCFIDESTGEPFQQQWFHDEWHRAMSIFPRVQIIAPRDHAKTSNIIGRLIWEVGKDPNLRTKVVCASDGKAKERLFEIDQHLRENKRIHEVFPELVPDENAPWNAHNMVVKRRARHRDSTFEALGITSTATGGRADLLVADDVVDRRNSLAFPALSAQVKQAWKSDWTNLLEPTGRIWYICTLWAPTDLSHQLMKNEAYHCIRYDIDDAFGAIWPSKWSEEALRFRFKEIDDSVEFNRAFRNIAVDLSRTMVNPAWFRYRDLRTDPEFNEALANDELEFITSYDPAGTPTGKKDQDYTGACIIAVWKRGRKIFVVDAWQDRLTLKQFTGAVWEEACRYVPWLTLIEKVGQATHDEAVINDYPEMRSLIMCTKPKVSKAMRLLATTGLLEDGDIVFSSHLDPHGDQFVPGRGSLVDQLIEFGVPGNHDDIADAFSQAVAKAKTHFLDLNASGKEDMDEREFADMDTEDYLYV